MQQTLQRPESYLCYSFKQDGVTCYFHPCTAGIQHSFEICKITADASGGIHQEAADDADLDLDDLETDDEEDLEVRPSTR